MADKTSASARRETGTFLVKRGLAEMLKGGVIMDVVTPEQAKIAEDAGAVAVMALERVPADIRRDGGVARMSDPEMIEGIKAAVTIPVMAKARIGHFVEAQILEALGVDYVDESEVLTPADEAHHIDKWAFTVPFVCGATNLGEALRRICEGACMIRSKGEAGTGNIVEAVRHLRSILGDIRKITQADSAELFDWAKRLQAPLPLVQEIAETGWLPVPAVLRRWHRHAGRRRAGHAARRRGRVRRLGHLQERRPGAAGQGHRRGHHHFRDADILAKVSRGLGAPMPGLEIDELDTTPAPTAAGERPSVSMSDRSRPPGAAGASGVLALQGAFAAHAARPGRARRRAASRSARRPSWTASTPLVMPGGESTTMSMLLESSGLFDPIAERLADGLPVLGTCAGMILLATEVLDGRADQRSFGAIDMTVRRNAFGRQVDSFEADLDVAGLGPEPLPRRVHPGARRRARRRRGRGAGRARRAGRAGPPGPGHGGGVPPRAVRRPAPASRRSGFLAEEVPLRPCPVIPSGRRSSTRRVPPTRPGASSSPSSSARSRWRPARVAATSR